MVNTAINKQISANITTADISALADKYHISPDGIVSIIAAYAKVIPIEIMPTVEPASRATIILFDVFGI